MNVEGFGMGLAGWQEDVPHPLWIPADPRFPLTRKCGNDGVDEGGVGGLDGLELQC